MSEALRNAAIETLGSVYVAGGNKKPKFNTFKDQDGSTVFARNGNRLKLKKGGDPCKSINNGKDPDPSEWDVVTFTIGEKL